MQKSLEDEVQFSDLEKKLQKQKEPETSENLLKSVSEQLLSMMIDVVKNEINPQTVNAACNCASEISKLLKINIELKKNGF